jgi:TolB-like protein
MICSTSYSIKAGIAWEMLALLLLSSCAPMAPPTPEGPLEFKSLVREEVGTPAAGSTTIRWTASAADGAGELSYEFRTMKDSEEIIVQEGPSPTWVWRPKEPGTFRVKATVRDAAGAQVDSGWSSELVIDPPVRRSVLIAVLPVENLTGGGAPLEMIVDLVRLRFRERGFRLVDNEVLEEFLKRYRIRNTSGLSAPLSNAIKEELGAEAFLITSLEAYQERDPPIVSLMSRLVLSGERPEIVWMDGIGSSGDGHPGLLGLGLIEDPETLLEQAIDCLAGSLERSLSGAGDTTPAGSANAYYRCNPRADLVALSPAREGKRRYRPQTFFLSPTFDAGRSYRVATIPFLNLSDRNNAGRIVALHLVKHLIHSDTFAVVEPGLLREQLLKYRMIMQAGPSLANVEIISSKDALGVDLVVSGTVFDYQDAFGVPKVDFSVKVIEATSRKTVWASRSHNSGGDGVFFFDVGRVHTAHHLASEMAWGPFEMLARGVDSPGGDRMDPSYEEHK